MFGLVYFLLVKQGVKPESLQMPDQRLDVIVGGTRRRMRASKEIEKGNQFTPPPHHLHSSWHCHTVTLNLLLLDRRIEIQGKNSAGSRPKNVQRVWVQRRCVALLRRHRIVLGSASMQGGKEWGSICYFCDLVAYACCTGGLDPCANDALGERRKQDRDALA